jgi:hypothetical protein
LVTGAILPAIARLPTAVTNNVFLIMISPFLLVRSEPVRGPKKRSLGTLSYWSYHYLTLQSYVRYIGNKPYFFREQNGCVVVFHRKYCL